MTEGAVGNVGKKRTRGSPGGSLILKEHSPLSIMKPNRENDQKIEMQVENPESQ